MDIRQLNDSNEQMQKLFENRDTYSNFTFGYVSINPGERVPKEGVSAHSEDEYSFIISGQLTGESGGENFEVEASNATFIPAGEEHWAMNNSDEECKIIWVFVKK